MRFFSKICVAVLLTMTVGSAAAQHYFGVRGGYGMGSIRPEPVMEKGMVSGLMSGGVSWKYYSRSQYVGGIQMDVEYIEKGFKLYERVGGDTTHNHYSQNIQMPFMWQPHVYLWRGKARFFLNLGVYLSYQLSADSSTVSKKQGVLSSGKYPLDVVRDNIWGYGLCGGGGFSVLLGRFDMFVEARYVYGYSDLFKNFNKYPTNYKRSAIDQINVSFGLFYRVGKGGILAPQGRRMKKMYDAATETTTTTTTTTTTKTP